MRYAEASRQAALAALPFLLAGPGPAVLIALGAIWGGSWAWLAIGWITVLVFCLDQTDIGAPGWLRADLLPGALGWLHFGIMALALWSVGAGHLGGAETLGLVIACGLYFGQIGHAVAHEPIHAQSRSAYRLGTAVYVSLLMGHHVSAHRLVHHVHAATPADPSSARFGEGFWRYVMRAWPGAMRAGRAEERRRGRDPYPAYTLGAVATLAAAAVLGGAAGILALLAMAAHAQVQILLSDYVQHYGLERPLLADGNRAPMRAAHSWNAPHWASGAMLLNAPRHSDHHMAPDRRFDALKLDPESMPMLPWPLPVMGVIALVPALWRMVMDPRVAALQPGISDPARAREIPQAVLDKVWMAGLGGNDLPELGHDPIAPAVPSDVLRRPRPRSPDERG